MKKFNCKVSMLTVTIALATSSTYAQQGLEPGKLDLSWYGVADVNVAITDSGYGRKTRIEGGGGMMASRLGVRANKSFASGITALAQLEAGIGFDTGAAGGGTPGTGTNVTAASSGGFPGTGSRLFARAALVGLKGDFGQLTIGRQYTGSYIAVAAVGQAYGDGFFLNAANLLPLIGGMPTRVDNSLIYISPTIGGFTGAVTYMAGAENNVNKPTGTATATGTDKSGSGYDLMLRYRTGAFDVGVSAWNVYNGAYNVTGGETGLAKKKGAQIVASVDLGYVKMAGAYVNGKISGGNYENVTKALSKATGFSGSVLIRLGDSHRHNVVVGYSELKDKSLLERSGKLSGVAYWYVLEDKTRLYASYGEMHNNANATYALADAGNMVGNVASAGRKPRGLEIGLNYQF